MNGIQIACYSLVASAFLLAGLLVFSLSQRAELENRAEAAMVISRDDFSLMTARTRANEEALWVLDNRSGRILIYRLSLRGAGSGRLELAGGIDLTAPNIFGGGGGAAAPRGGGGR